MTITFRQFQTFRDGLQDFIDFNSCTTCAETQLYRVDPSKAIAIDINSGIPMGDTFRHLFGPAHATQTGKDVVFNVQASHLVGVAIDESADGTSWPSLALAIHCDFDAASGQAIGVRFRPSLAFYRFRITGGIGKSISKVFGYSQVRDPGV